MDRRDFLKICSVMAAAGVLYGCRKIPFVGESAKEGARTVPSLKDFEDEVRKAMMRGGDGLDLVKVPMPAKKNAAGADSMNRFGMAI